MNSLFGKPKMPDTSKQEALLKQKEDAIALQESERKKALAAKGRAGAGASSTSSLLSGLDTGVTPVGAKRTTLG